MYLIHIALSPSLKVSLSVKSCTNERIAINANSCAAVNLNSDDNYFLNIFLWHFFILSTWQTEIQAALH